MKINIDQIEAGARKATPGPWQWKPSSEVRLFPRAFVCTVSDKPEFICDGLLYEDDIPHIANCSPESILAMVEVVRAVIRIDEVASKGFTSSLDFYQAIDEAREALTPFTGGGDDMSG